ncbi:protein of unknown function [Cupriavidus taiwanensis]|uniref:Uncharacterized protein n=1 Tax=Cupriavidus taiwanensis TaxID=164546 RepID=A0A9Q7UU86_9BURK|nr:protein of unknown function [Cupriavidus taiwanensis]
MRQREVDRLDPVLVGLGVRVLVEAADGVGGLQAKFLFERLDKGLEHVQDHRLGAAQCLVRFLVDQRGEDDRRHALVVERLVDLADGDMCLFRGIDEGHAHLAEAHFELGQDGMAEGLGGDAGAIRDDKHGAHRGALGRLGRGRRRGCGLRSRRGPGCRRSGRFWLGHGEGGINRLNLPQKSAAQHGRIAAIFSLSNSIGWPAAQHAHATNRARNCRQCALRDESRSARSAAPVRGCLAKRSVREQNINNIPGMRNQFSTLF